MADQQPVVLCGLRSILAPIREIQIVAEAGDGLKAVQLIERYKPDILITGLNLAGVNGLELIIQATKRSPLTRLVVFSRSDHATSVWEALKRGAIAYILKTAEPAEIVRALREVLSNRPFLSPIVSEFNLDSILKTASRGRFDLYQTLTDRERQILQMCGESQNSKMIGSVLGISPRTVEAHRANLMSKLGFHRLSQVVAYAVKRQLEFQKRPNTLTVDTESTSDLQLNTAVSSIQIAKATSSGNTDTGQLSRQAGDNGLSTRHQV